jgi:acyl-CoA synthetase (AMP-forming)/AMP-acid ligase II
VGSIPIANCGKPCGNAEVKIVAPNSILELKNREIGEIWVSGPAVSKGYWKDPETTEKTWVSWLDRKWLNTGDLGFIHEGELYVTGRTKEILIINGVNYYPQDIEDELERQLDFVAPNGVAAFPAPVDGVEQLGLVIEIAKEASRLENSETSDGAQISPEYYRHAVVRLLKRHFDVPLGQFCCVLAGGILRTTSGKKRRNETRIALLAGDLPMWQPVTMEQRP